MTGGWSSLPSDLLEQVSARLRTDADHLYAHQVCTHWRASTRLPAACRPWIFTRRTKWSRLGPPDGDYSFWLLHRVQRVDIRAPPAGLSYCRGASRGWLALVDHPPSPTRLVLWEPLSNTQIPLPCLNPVSQVFLSGDPLTPSSDWVAVASQPYGNTKAQKMLWWRPGDAAWSVLSERATAVIGSVAFHGGKIYYLDTTINMFVYDISLGTASPPTCVQMLHISITLDRLCRCERSHATRGAYVVTCGADLLLVVLRLPSGRSHYHPSFAEVYKPEWAPDGQLQLRERVTDLGDHSLFLGPGDTFALSAKDFPAIKRNHVYGIAHERNYIGGRTLHHWVFVFDLGSDALEEIPYPGELRDDGTNWSPRSWFCLRRPFMIHDAASSSER